MIFLKNHKKEKLYLQYCAVFIDEDPQVGGHAQFKPL